MNDDDDAMNDVNEDKATIPVEEEEEVVVEDAKMSEIEEEAGKEVKNMEECEQVSTEIDDSKEVVIEGEDHGIVGEIQEINVVGEEERAREVDREECVIGEERDRDVEKDEDAGIGEEGEREVVKDEHLIGGEKEREIEKDEEGEKDEFGVNGKEEEKREDLVGGKEEEISLAEKEDVKEKEKEEERDEDGGDGEEEEKEENLKGGEDEEINVAEQEEEKGKEKDENEDVIGEEEKGVEKDIDMIGEEEEREIEKDEDGVIGEREVKDEDMNVEEGGLAEMEDDGVGEEEGEEEVEEEKMVEENEVEAIEVKGSGGGKRKRGKSTKAPVKSPAKPLSRKSTGEDVCFICFDGGDLVLCDRRGCPKAYHPSCVNRDEAFFRAKGRWNCGWHLCSNCEKGAHYMCYTCTFSLCKGCIKDATILCVRGNKGFCETCMRTVTLIENNEDNKEMDDVDFNDKNSWEYLFKDYWTELKEKLSLTKDEISQAKNPWKGSEAALSKQTSTDEQKNANHDTCSGSESSSENLEASRSRRKRARKRSKPIPKEDDSPSEAPEMGAVVMSSPTSTDWASKELLEFVMHMKDGDQSVLSQFDVQALLLEYIKRNKLRDPRRKSQIICDTRLQNLFGKPRVGHFEMLKLLESHFLIKEDSQTDDLQGSVVDTEASQLDTDGNADALSRSGREKGRKMRRKGDERGLLSNLNDYAAIDVHNINLIYLRRNLMEELIEDKEKFHDNVVGSFVRIRISASTQKQDIYRLVQVIGTSKAAEPYKTGKRMTDIMLEIQNLDKTELISIDIISNQEFTEEECRRLRQSIKFGLINRLTVGDILEKATALQSVRVKDWLETETVRLSHLRDRASEKGRRKEYPFSQANFEWEFFIAVDKLNSISCTALSTFANHAVILDLTFTLRVCVEKLQLLKTPEERERRLQETPEVHSDPKMDPSYESEEEDENDKKRESFTRPRGSGFSRKAREPISPSKGGAALNDAWSGTRNSNTRRELNRTISDKGFSNKGEVVAETSEMISESTRNQGRERDRHLSGNKDKSNTASNLETGAWSSHPVARSDSFSQAASQISAPPRTIEVVQPASAINETEKMWHYQDPTGKVQGPFSIVQLRKWNNTGYFPANLRVWRTTQRQEDSTLLSDFLSGRLQKEQPVSDINLQSPKVQNSQLLASIPGKSYATPLQVDKGSVSGDRWNTDLNRRSLNLRGTLGSPGESSAENWARQTEISALISRTGVSSFASPGGSKDMQDSEYGQRNDHPNLPSPTPSSNSGTGSRGQASQDKWSPTSFHAKRGNSGMEGNRIAGGNNGALHGTADAGTEGHHLTHSSLSPSGPTKQSGGFDRSSAPTQSTVLSSRSDPQIPSQSNVTNVSQQVQADSRPSAPDPTTSMNRVPDPSHNHVEIQGWASASASQPPSGNGNQSWGVASVPSQHSAYGQWGNPSSFTQSSAPSVGAGNTAGNFLTPGYPAVPQNSSWRPPVVQQQANLWGTSSNMQAVQPAPNMQPPQPYLQPPTSQTPNVQPQAPNIQTPAHAPSNMLPAPPSFPTMPPNMQANPNFQSPVPPNLPWSMPVPGNLNPNQNMLWGQTQVIPNMGWGVPAQGNSNVNWGAAAQAPMPGNPNAGGWVAPTGNQPTWGSEQNQSGRGPRGGDSSHNGGNRSRNRQSSFRSGGSWSSNM
ncbi:GYF domain [Dillenia turbinata]|uniref:GYF domain n=1 Tax=Dillenia turbinata TaxID=194707 RepID=A0AAN8ZTJ4_9MAGN